MVDKKEKSAATRQRVSVDILLSITAVITSVCALGITFYQAYLQRTQQYASVIPILQTFNTSEIDDDKTGYAFVVANKGLGPAFIEAVTLDYEGKSYDDIDKLLPQLKDSTAFANHVTTSTLSKGLVIPQGESIRLVEIAGGREGSWLRRKIADRMKVTIVYRSVYKQKWRFTNQSETIDDANVELE